MVPARPGVLSADVDGDGDGQVRPHLTARLLVRPHASQQACQEHVVDGRGVGLACRAQVVERELQSHEPAGPAACPQQGRGLCPAVTVGAQSRVGVRRPSGHGLDRPERAVHHDAHRGKGALLARQHALRRRLHHVVAHRPQPGPSLLQRDHVCGRRVGFEVEQVSHHVQGPHAVCDRVVQAEQKDRAPVCHAGHQRRVPQWSCGVERCGCGVTRHGQHSCDRSVPGSADTSQVAGDVELVVRHPLRTRKRSVGNDHTLPHPRHCPGGAVEGVRQTRRLRSTSQDERRAHDGAGRRIRVAPQQQCIQRRDEIREVVGHLPAASFRLAPRTR